MDSGSKIERSKERRKNGIIELVNIVWGSTESSLIKVRKGETKLYYYTMEISQKFWVNSTGFGMDMDKTVAVSHAVSV
jgi:hypothetical protein